MLLCSAALIDYVTFVVDTDFVPDLIFINSSLCACGLLSVCVCVRVSERYSDIVLLDNRVIALTPVQQVHTNYHCSLVMVDVRFLPDVMWCIFPP